MRQLAWAFTFFVFDRDARKVRPGASVALAVLGLHLASDHLLSGNWMQQAGFASATHVAPAATTSVPAAAGARPAPPLVTTCRTEASR